ncbi:serine/threonine-protein kinase LMTK1 [Tenrec ecaudatus]|uniref:serine/threonine-protein kinase LMTK1 n=1 Tax=Tenrec ecaudatus TaxID=94439 RepID=UPI003F595291
MWATSFFKLCPATAAPERPHCKRPSPAERLHVVLAHSCQDPTATPRVQNRTPPGPVPPSPLPVPQPVAAATCPSIWARALLFLPPLRFAKHNVLPRGLASPDILPKERGAGSGQRAAGSGEPERSGAVRAHGCQLAARHLRRPGDAAARARPAGVLSCRRRACRAAGPAMSSSFFNPSFAFSSHFDPGVLGGQWVRGSWVGTPLQAGALQILVSVNVVWGLNRVTALAGGRNLIGRGIVGFPGDNFVLEIFQSLSLNFFAISHWDRRCPLRAANGAPLSELSWSSSLAVVAVSFSGLFSVVVLMLACLCCKKGAIGFKELENAEGDEYAASFSAHGSPAATGARGGPDVYILPLAEVSLPAAKQPGRSVQLLKCAEPGRHSLLYLKEIGHGWFGKVFLGEVTSGVSSSQVVVKELKASASVQEQSHFLEEAQPYRALQHNNLLPCLAQCAEVTPYLLVMELCPLGDLKGFLRSCRMAESMAPDPLTLQRMACEVACGILHLHHHHYVHSDLALRNCLLSADLTVKIGDYGMSHCKYREDYFVTADQLWVPLRWIAPELVDEVHSNVLVVGQTKASNVWSLGVTIWELFELGLQPYPNHSDRQVLAYAIREQQLKLPKPQLPLPLSDRWYEVMQFCWLQPEQRPTAEEVHLLLSYLCAKGATEAEEEFERRWRSLRPGGAAGAGEGGAGPGAGLAGPSLVGVAELATASSFPLLEQFSGDGFHADSDDVLTVTETSRGLNFEYKWEAGHGVEPFLSPGRAPLSPGCASRLQELCAPDGAPPGVVPVLSAHSPSVGSEYFIRLEEPAAGHGPDCASCARSPRAARRDDEDSSDDSTHASLAMESLLGHAPSAGGPWGHCDYHLRLSHAQGSSPGALMVAEQGTEEDLDWGEAAFCPGFFEDPLGVSPAGSGGARPSPGGEEAEARRAAQHPHWSSNVSANNNSGRAQSFEDTWLGREESSLAGTQPGPLPAQQDPEELLLGSPTTSPDHQPAHCPGPLGHCLVEGLAPGTIVSPWAETAVSGDSGTPGAEPMLVEDPGGSHRPQQPLTLRSSPSQEGAPLPAFPTPAAQLVGTPESDGSSLEPPVRGSEDKDSPDPISGVSADLSSVGPLLNHAAAAASRSLKQIGLPAMLTPLDIAASASDGVCDVFSPAPSGTPGGQPRALDSGYDTENYESPEFVLKETPEAPEPQAFSEPGSARESPGLDTQPSTSPVSDSDSGGGGLSAKNPYRDSAYFSDLDAEPEPPAGTGDKLDCVVRVPAPALQPVNSPSCPLGPGLPGEVQGAGPREASLPPSPAEESSPEPSACPGLPGPLEAPPAPHPSRSQFFLLTPVRPGSEDGPPEVPQERTRADGGAERPAGPGVPRAPLCLALPGLAPEDRPEEDQEDSEDSEESDEELRCYSVQEPSEESEEEAQVPVVVECRRARNLRSLLRMPPCEDPERKKKAVSFFDDVTVYLFDQESPTRELGEPFPGAKEAPPMFLAGGPGSPSVPGRLRRASEPQGQVVAEGGGLEWDHEFPLVQAQAALATALGARVAEPTPSAPPKPVALGSFSRFTVSPTPTPTSRFSITQVSDSAVEAVGGPAQGTGSGNAEA